jgi:putative spermidine/putrescine transport system permease protein
MWNGIRENTDPAVAAAAVILLAVTFAAFLIWGIAQHRARKPKSNPT